ncbi:hypothetical protein GCM10009623_27350 [Nocardioides aestuarii]|uniref:DUF4349 domain-containing protein n=1 Tax=Nocardioides aestuarii TaxID=252231 RepID=A0ABW4TQW0_9ACTN
MTRRTRIAALLLTVGLALMACSSGAEESATGEPAADAPAGAAGGRDAVETEVEAADEMAYDADGANLSVARVAGKAVPAEDVGMAPAVIQIGTMTVRSDDVAGARVGVEKVVDAYGGSIADEKTMASTEGEVRTSKVVLRIPAADFDAAMLDLAKLGEVTGSTRKAEDVTGDVIDTRARIRAQEQSLERVEVLFARAQNIRDIVAIEAQLSRRQAELDSLKGQLAWLEDQTSMSTITVYLEKAPEPAPVPKQTDDDNAFVGGVKAGWDALSEVGAGLATVTGAVLPFALVALLLGLPAALVLRRWLAAHPLRRPAAEVDVS